MTRFCSFCCSTRAAVAGVLAVFLAVAGSASAADPMIITSATKQFVVRGLPLRSALSRSPDSEFVSVDPALLAVTGETVKRTLERELGWDNRWSGTFYINIHPIRSENDRIRVATSRADGRWRYHVELPDEVRRRELIELLVELLLVEFSDRAGSRHSVELPPWLAIGLTAHLMQGSLSGAALQARTLNEIRAEPSLRSAQTTRYSDFEKRLRDNVQRRGALTFDQLNWPTFDPRDTEASTAYRESAQLFVRELLRLRGGPDCLSAMLAMLPAHLNWQTAFFRGFETHFQRMVDVEKWWSLCLTQWKTHDNALVWSAAEARQKLDEILYVPMETRLEGEDAPRVQPVSLQTIIQQWRFDEQAALLKPKVVQLQGARVRLPAELAPLADAYRTTLEKYLHARSSAWFGVTARTAASRAIAELNALDAQRGNIPAALLTARASGAVPLTHP